VNSIRSQILRTQAYRSASRRAASAINCTASFGPLGVPTSTTRATVLRLRGKGVPGRGKGEAGDALVEISIKPHRFFTREGDDIHVEIPVTLTEAVLGGRINVPTPSGPVTMTVPKHANIGTVLRLKGKGVGRPGGKHGDEFVNLKVMLPDRPDPELDTFLREMQP
jgi:DnaJ-class molecular chaperone